MDLETNLIPVDAGDVLRAIAGDSPRLTVTHSQLLGMVQAARADAFRRAIRMLLDPRARRN